MDKRTPTAVYSTADMVQATLLAQLLEDAGIDCHVVNNMLRNVVGEVPVAKTEPQIWVAAEDRDAAAAICRSFDERLRSRLRLVNVSAGTVFCYHCGETVGELAEICPACNGQLEVQPPVTQR